jgi:hypothetical protein
MSLESVAVNTRSNAADNSCFVQLAGRSLYEDRVRVSTGTRTSRGFRKRREQPTMLSPFRIDDAGLACPLNAVRL